MLAATDLLGQLIQFLQQLILPDWGDLISLLPYALILLLVGPILTILLLAWFHHRVTRKRGRIRLDEPSAVPAERDLSGEPIVPPNTPYCPRHALIYPAHAKTCEVDREELMVRCPVDDTLRSARQEVCRACGTRYVLGASLAPVTVRGNRRPPEGGAAVA